MYGAGQASAPIPRGKPAASDPHAARWCVKLDGRMSRLQPFLLGALRSSVVSWRVRCGGANDWISELLPSCFPGTLSDPSDSSGLG